MIDLGSLQRMASLTSNPAVVLVVEDEALVRMIVVEILGDNGMTVVEAEHADAAIETLNDRGGEVHAVFTDINMPGEMDGVGLCHHVRRHWPLIALLVTSGRHPTRDDLPNGARFIAKPYDTSHVLQHIREMIEAV